jgi:putative transposase
MNEHKEYNKIKLRNELSLNHRNQDRLWLLNTPKAVRDLAVFEANKNMKTGFTQLKNKTVSHFKLQYKQRKKVWTIDLPKSGMVQRINKNQVHLFPRILKDNKLLKLQESITIQNDCKLHFDGINYFLIVPKNVENQNIHNRDTTKIISLDPGVRTFQTGYSPDGVCYQLGDKASNRIYRLYLFLDTLISRRDTTTGKQKRYLNKHILRLRIKIKNLINEMHHKISLFLVKHFKTILLPSFETKGMVSKLNRKIRSKTVRNMLGLSHFKFQEILKYKSTIYNSRVIIVDEYYTSKTCGKCGNLKDNLGGNKVYKCSRCGVTLDRDINGARNILLRAMRDTSIE